MDANGTFSIKIKPINKDSNNHIPKRSLSSLSTADLNNPCLFHTNIDSAAAYGIYDIRHEEYRRMENSNDIHSYT